MIELAILRYLPMKGVTFYWGPIVLFKGSGSLPIHFSYRNSLILLIRIRNVSKAFSKHLMDSLKSEMCITSSGTIVDILIWNKRLIFIFKQCVYIYRPVHSGNLNKENRALRQISKLYPPTSWKKPYFLSAIRCHSATKTSQFSKAIFSPFIYKYPYIIYLISACIQRSDHFEKNDYG